MFNEKFVTDYINATYEPEGIAFDIGANHGLYTKVLAERFKKVYAFEPIPYNIGVLKRAVSNFPNVEVIEKAVSDKTGLTDIFICLGNDGGHTLNENLAGREAWGHKKERKTTIQTITLDEFVEQNGIEKIDFIKCDTEGAENFLFNGAVDTLKRLHDLKIILEVHHDVDYARLYQFFTDLGYKIFDSGYNRATELSVDNHYLIQKSIL